MENSKPTIIHLLSHRPSLICLKYKTPEEYIAKHDDAEFYKLEKYPYWVGFFQDFHHKTAVDVMKVTDKYNHECWRPYWSSIGRSYEKIYEGVHHKVYPSRYFILPKIKIWLWSKSYLEDLKLRIKQNDKVLLHIHDGHSNFITWLLLNLKPENIPILYQQRGGAFAIFDYKHRRKIPTTLLTYKKQIEIMKYISHYMSISRVEYDFLKNDLKINDVSLFIEGTDFDYFVPGDKVAMRKKLNLPLDKKIIIFVGRFDAVNGADNLLKLFKRLKDNNQNVQVLMIGGYKHNPSYKMAVDSGAIVIERIHEPKLRDYYQASDLYVLAVDDYLYKKFAGFGITPIQALACGVPVLSHNIIHFPCTEEINKIGRIYNNDDDLYENTIYMLENKEEFANCREIAMKYYDKKITTKILVDKYEELFSRYYK
jgi:glycosyltransferase involved in cell wall biosynthesis